MIQGTLRARQPRGETRLRWQCQGIWHEQILPITRRGTLQELVWLPVGATQVGQCTKAQASGAVVAPVVYRFTAGLHAGGQNPRRQAAARL
ncbi:hypothetical protein [Escherichia coli]|uniref:hypothetical protein n=1 Tax=Escherichia coli TaxID=562 RepID=UPI001F49BDC0|nr:hypothetical protein [Escherichia coli]